MTCRNGWMVILLGMPCLALAQSTPIGLWRLIDDTTQQERSHVRITESQGQLVGRIEKLLQPPQTPTCVKCTDDRKDQPILGLTILRQISARADEDGVYSGGHILDPRSGELYRARLRLQDQGRQLEVRGYIGVPLLGRSQTWVRID